MGSKMAVATAAAKKKGYKSFKQGSAGDKKRDEIAEAIAKRHHIVKGPARKSAKRRGGR
jgi:hypothetical protein